MSLEVDNLQVYYRTLHGDVQAVDGVTFAIADGEIAGLAGESGCGKTTLARASSASTGGCATSTGASGSTAPSCRSGRRGDEPLPLQRGLADSAVRAERAQPDAEDRPSIADLLESRGVAFDEKLPELKRRLALVGLSADVLDRYPIELSGGMKQRVVMVLSTLLDPSLLIADELTSALDVSTQKAVAEMLVEFRDRGLRQEHDRDHPRPGDPVPDRRHDPRHVRRQARRAGAGGHDRRRSAAPVHACSSARCPRSACASTSTG